MPANALKAQIVVQAGLMPGQPDPFYTRVWHFDHQLIEETLEDPTDFRYRDAFGAALNYAAFLQHPGHLNWVKMEWTWL